MVDEQHLHLMALNIALATACNRLAGLRWNDPSYGSAFRSIAAARTAWAGGATLPPTRIVVLARKGTSYLDTPAAVCRLKDELGKERTRAAATFPVISQIFFRTMPFQPPSASWTRATQATLDTLDDIVGGLGNLESPPAENRPTHGQLEEFLRAHNEVLAENMTSLVTALTELPLPRSPLLSKNADAIAKAVGTILQSLRDILEPDPAPYVQAEYRLTQWVQSFGEARLATALARAGGRG
jgi:hypothetical protein